MSRTVSREKYNSLKEKASQWREKALDYKNMYENILLENEKLIDENEYLQDNLHDIPNIEESNHEREEELEREIYELRHEIKLLNKKNRSFENKHNKDQFDVERRLLLKEAEVDRLNAALEDYKERYKEFRDEVRMLRRDRGAIVS